MAQELLIVGAGGFARETAAAVREMPSFRLLGFLDDNVALHGLDRGGIPVLGGLDLVGRYPDAAVVVCVGNPRNYTSRERVVASLNLPESRYATVVHPTAFVGQGCVIGPGTVILAQSVLTADVTVGRHVAVMPHVTLTHDTVIEDYVTIASGVRLGGGVVVERGAYLGAGALLRESVRVGARSQLGMGSVALRDIPPGQVWVGNPARYLREAYSPSLSNPSRG